MTLSRLRLMGGFILAGLRPLVEHLVHQSERLGLVRADKAKGSVKTKRKSASWSMDALTRILQLK